MRRTTTHGDLNLNSVMHDLILNKLFWRENMYYPVQNGCDFGGQTPPLGLDWKRIIPFTPGKQKHWLIQWVSPGCVPISKLVWFSEHFCQVSCIVMIIAHPAKQLGWALLGTFQASWNFNLFATCTLARFVTQPQLKVFHPSMWNQHAAVFDLESISTPKHWILERHKSSWLTPRNYLLEFGSWFECDVVDLHTAKIGGGDWAGDWAGKFMPKKK